MDSYSRYLKLNIKRKQSIFLWGARKTGKSTYLRHRFAKSIFIDFLDTDVFYEYSKRAALLREIVLNLPENKRDLPIIVDEVQKVPAVMDEVHWLIENSDTTFILCGSSSRSLKRKGSNLLGGRALRYNFYPLVYPEIKEDFDLLRIFNDGLIPPHYGNDDAYMLLKSYVQDYLTEEVRIEGYVRNITAFSRFFDSTRFSCGEMVNYSNIARDVGIDAKTIKEYYQILVDMLVGYLIYPYVKKVSRNIISHTPKFYYFDVGLANRIARSKVKEMAGIAAGKSLENYVLMELIAYIGLNALDHEVFYWRTNTGLEVDFIVSDQITAPIALEVKISTMVHNTELKGLKAFLGEQGLAIGYVICLERMSRKIILDDNRAIIILPIQEFLEKLWAGKLIES